MKSPTRSGIYALRLDNLYYVGSSKDIDLRLRMHMSRLRANTHHCNQLQQVFNRLPNESWESLVLEESSIDMLLPLEQSWVNRLSSMAGIRVLNATHNISVKQGSILNSEFRNYHQLLEETAMREF